VDGRAVAWAIGAAVLLGPTVAATYWGAKRIEASRDGFHVGHVAPAASLPPETPGAPACPARDYERGMSRGRNLLARGDYRVAARAFDEAVRARPFDARARELRARARVFLGTATHEELEVARALATDDEVVADVDYDQGMLFERDGNDERARRSFVRAERHGSREALAKLGPASRCTVSVRQGSGLLPVGSPALRREGKYWVLRARGHDTDRDWAGRVPGDFSDGPGASYLFFAHRWDDTEDPCKTGEELACDRRSPGMAGDVCANVDGSKLVDPDTLELLSYFDASGKPLVHLLLDEGDESRIQVAFAGRSAHVTGGGCDLSVPF
jgi:hypothetical protein